MLESPPFRLYWCRMQAAVTFDFLQGIPLSIRQRLNLRPGTVMDFDEDTPYL